MQGRDAGLPAKAQQDCDAELQYQDDAGAEQVSQCAAGEHSGSGFWVDDAGIDRPHVALPLLARLTPRWSSEWPLRPFLETHPDITHAYLHTWAGDPDEDVRRLVSEGTRPRLPWPASCGLVADPNLAVALPDELVDDESEYVRRSVAN